MAGIIRKAMVFLGLDDEETDEYDGYDDAAVAAQPPRRFQSETAEHVAADRPIAGIRPLPRDSGPDGGGAVRITPPAAPVQTLTASPEVHAHIVVPTRFADAQEIGELFKKRTPIVVNLKEADGPLSRRMIDFCSGVTYALSGAMEKLADHVFLLTPEHLEVPADERRRLHDRGFYDT